jgi:ABC-2 type transport system ATP-binding protein
MTVSMSVEEVSKRFRLIHQRSNTIKERLVHGRRTTYEDLWALRDVSFTVRQGEALGLLGHNGSGKSTLLRCVAGILRPTTGRIRTAGRVAALLALGSGFHPELTGRQNVYLYASILGLNKAEVDRRFDEIVSFSELPQFMDIQVRQYSSGMYARLAFAVAVCVDPDILIVDEVLAVGDEGFQQKCIDRIFRFKRQGRTIVFVSHSAGLISRICDRAVVLDHGHLVADDDVENGLRALRRTLGETPREEPAAVGKEIAFREVALGYPAGDEHLAPGEPLEVRVEIASQVCTDDVVVGLELRDDRDRQLLVTSSDALGAELHLRPGRAAITFRFAAMPPLHGRYHLDLRLRSTDGGTEHDRRASDRFEVVNPGYAAELAFPLEVEVQPSSDARRAADS